MSDKQDFKSQQILIYYKFIHSTFYGSNKYRPNIKLCFVRIYKLIKVLERLRFMGYAACTTKAKTTILRLYFPDIGESNENKRKWS